MSARSVAELISDGAPLIRSAEPEALVDAVVLLTHRLHDVTEDHGHRSRQADDLRAQRRRVRQELVSRATP